MKTSADEAGVWCENWIERDSYFLDVVEVAAIAPRCTAVVGPPFARSGAERARLWQGLAGAERSEHPPPHIPATHGGSTKERVYVVLAAGHFVGKDGIVAHLLRDGWVPHRL